MCPGGTKGWLGKAPNALCAMWRPAWGSALASSRWGARRARGRWARKGADMTTVVLMWLAVVALIVVGLAGTVLPALPGTLFVFAGIALGAWIDDFQRVSAFTVGLAGALALLAWVLDYVAGLLGAKKAGASRQALVGAALGTVVGLFMGLVGVLFMPLVGAAIGEYMAQRDHRQSLKVGVSTWVGMMLGMLAKVALSFMMVGIFVIALLF